MTFHSFQLDCVVDGGCRPGTLPSSALFKPRSHTAFSKPLFKPQHLYEKDGVA